MTNKDLIFASLMGSDNVKMYQRSQIVQNELVKHVLPTIPFVPVNGNVNPVQNTGTPNFNFNQMGDSIPESQQFFPLSFSFTENGQKWLFPYEPMINISSGNNIVERNVAKRSSTITNGKKDPQFGTVKERWSRKDIEIQITGALIGSKLKGTPAECFPKKQMERLLEFLTVCGALYVYSEPLEILGITRIVVYDWSFPFTKGENVQAYDLKVKSDTAFDLLIKS